MQRNRNIIKYISLCRCPPQAFGELTGTNAIIYTQANLANSCRKLYTELMSSGRRIAEIRKAIIARQQKDDMTWVKLTCNLKNGKKKPPRTASDYLSMPLKRCLDLSPCHIGSVKHNICPECIGNDTADITQKTDDPLYSPIIQSEPNINNFTYRGRIVCHECVKFNNVDDMDELLCSGASSGKRSRKLSKRNVQASVTSDPNILKSS
ncbi:hypothetical protein AWZ03_005312 [Drosophila navojoa]|uniref:Uncharacterized protein n=1 Tax=Drosophila navojoa TaxID=7232 RepID=A0A484BHW8_DRONA|nr:hypothetical protein AWZ03_005312 [Drosophila navojoa]